MFDPQAEEKDRRVQREKVLAALRRARSTGCTNGELNEICFRYGARIWEMRHDPENPLKISTVREGKSQFRYFLAAEHWQGGDPR
jgi:hypothetical protein